MNRDHYIRLEELQVLIADLEGRAILTHADAQTLDNARAEVNELRVALAGVKEDDDA